MRESRIILWSIQASFPPPGIFFDATFLHYINYLGNSPIALIALDAHSMVLCRVAPEASGRMSGALGLGNYCSGVLFLASPPVSQPLHRPSKYCSNMFALQFSLPYLILSGAVVDGYASRYGLVAHGEAQRQEDHHAYEAKNESA